MSPIEKLIHFMRRLAPPTPLPDPPGGATSIASGRASDVAVPIRAHQSPRSEANSVIERYRALSSAKTRDPLNFLRSL